MKIKTFGCKGLMSFIIFILFIAFTANVEGQSPVPPQKIALDIKGMDIIDVLKIISSGRG